MWLRWLDRRRQIYYAPSQWAWVRDGVDLTEAECAEAAWFVTATGEKYRGAGAISKAFDTVFLTRWLFYGVYRLPLLRQFYDWLYDWIAHNRRYLSRGLRLLGADVTVAIRQEPPWNPLSVERKS